MLSKKLFQLKNRGIIIRLELLYYLKNIPIAMLNNMCILIGLINRAEYQAVDIVLDENSMSNF